MPGKWRTGENKPVVALDIDGTLGDYHSHFLWFAERYLGRPMPSPEAINPGLPLWRHMRVSKPTYRACKLAYRQGGLKRWMPVYPGASEMTHAIRRSRAELWICTTRPYLRLDNIDPDTKFWLAQNRIQYDAVLFGEAKYRDLVRQVGSGRIVAAADDQVDDVAAAKRAGIERVYLLDKPYNQNVSIEGAFRVRNINQLHRLILIDLKDWRLRND